MNWFRYRNLVIFLQFQRRIHRIVSYQSISRSNASNLFNNLLSIMSLLLIKTWKHEIRFNRLIIYRICLITLIIYAYLLFAIVLSKLLFWATFLIYSDWYLCDAIILNNFSCILTIIIFRDSFFFFDINKPSIWGFDIFSWKSSGEFFKIIFYAAFYIFILYWNVAVVFYHSIITTCLSECFTWLYSYFMVLIWLWFKLFITVHQWWIIYWLGSLITQYRLRWIYPYPIVLTTMCWLIIV